MTHVGYRFYYLFIVCNATNALFFYLLLPETARRPLEEMNHVFSRAPWIVAGRAAESYSPHHDLEGKTDEIAREKAMGLEVEVGRHEGGRAKAGWS